jgi:hypothetical protein
METFIVAVGLKQECTAYCCEDILLRGFKLARMNCDVCCCGSALVHGGRAGSCA